MSGTAVDRRGDRITPARRVAYATVSRTVDDRAWADRVFDIESGRADLDPRERSFAQHLSFGTVRHLRTLDHVVCAAANRPATKIDAAVMHALRLGTFQLLFSDGVPARAAIDQSVEQVRSVAGERAVGFANGVLRTVQRTGMAVLERLDPSDPSDLGVLLSYPDWIIGAMGDAHGDDGIAALAAQNRSDGVGSGSIRINTLHADAARADAIAASLGVELAHVPDPFTIAVGDARVSQGSTAALQPLVDGGLLMAQSLASMLVVVALAPKPGERILDMCAAPGSKTTQIAAAMGNDGSIVACELHEHRARSLQERLDRAGVTCARVVVGDATTVDLPADGFDRVLVDAPCSGLGVLSRHPDARWRDRAERPNELPALQGRLLQRAATLVRPGGVVVYSTCTLLPPENEGVVDRAVREFGLMPDPLPGTLPRRLRIPGSHHMARTLPQRDGTDGFFIARLRRTPRPRVG